MVFAKWLYSYAIWWDHAGLETGVVLVALSGECINRQLLTIRALQDDAVLYL